MRFSIISILAFVAAAVAQNGPNAFDLPTGTLVLTAGQAKTLTWSNKAGNTVTLLLREGANSDLKTVSTIASNIANTGSYTWTPPADTPEGADYAIEIINDDDTSQINYTEQFVIQSNVKAVASGSSTGVVTATGSMATGSASASASASASGSMTGSASGSMTTMTGSASASGSATASGSSKGASSTSAGSGTVPTNAAAKPAVGAVGGLLAVAAGFAIAM